MDSDWSLYVVDGTFSGASSRASRAKFFFIYAYIEGNWRIWANLAYIEGKFGFSRAAREFFGYICIFRGKVWIGSGVCL